MPGLLAGQERLELLATDCGPPTGWPDPIGGNCTRLRVSRRLQAAGGPAQGTSRVPAVPSMSPARSSKPPITARAPALAFPAR